MMAANLFQERLQKCNPRKLLFFLINIRKTSKKFKAYEYNLSLGGRRGWGEIFEYLTIIQGFKIRQKIPHPLIIQNNVCEKYFEWI
jgi:hypothetical protein